MSFKTNIIAENVSSLAGTKQRRKMDFATVQRVEPMLQDWLRYIQEVNRRCEGIIRDGKEFYIPFMALPTPVVKMVFTICEHFELAPNVRYLALYIYDKFMCNNFWESYKHDMQSRSDSAAWVQICRRISSQSKLRLMSCIQIASKVDSHSKCLGISQVISILGDIDQGHDYTPNSVFTSEIKVFKGVGFRIPLATPLDCVQILIAATNLDKTKNFNEIVLNVLDLSYLQHQQLYSHLQFTVNGRTAKSEEEQKHFMAMETNVPFLGASVVLCAALLFDFKKNDAVAIALKLADLVEIDENDIWGLANLLFALATQEDDSEV